MRPLRLRTACALVFGSGFCALVYQVVWMRHLRLIFGASTAASAAVLAIFMAGLGLGSIWLGARADRTKRPLLLYGNLELAIAVTAAASPLTVALARQGYLSLGGGGTRGLLDVALQLVLASLVLLPPTFLMGGTLPALARSVEQPDDADRKSLGALYGVNTLGAVVGAFLATFTLIEVFGVQTSMWLAAGINALIAVMARARGREHEVAPDEPAASAPSSAAPVPARFVYLAAATVGLVFFAMELVWYRLFAPLLGGSVYSFGLVLTMALAGVGVGGALYARGRDRVGVPRATLRAFALTCALEAALIAVPHAVGDGMVGFTLASRGLGLFGFWGLVGSWSLVTALVVFPPAVVAGYQFPLLVGLLGSGREGVGKQLGRAYAFNTAGAIAGSLIVGFGLMQALGAVGVWALLVTLLVGLAAYALVLARTRRVLAPLAVGLAAVGMLAAPGPTAAWRHSPVGAGRVPLPDDRNAYDAFVQDYRWRITWEAEGRETAVALDTANSYSFIVGGKSDGNAVLDAPTVVMSPLIGSMLHPDPKLGLVIGLGTGMSAGWLAAVPGMERVDVYELEPVIEHVAQVSALVNKNALENPRVNVIYGDGRALLQTSDAVYDVVMSEPSNPYRAGIASLFSQDFYQSAVAHMSDDGIFVQWLQGYEVDALTVRTVVATMRSVFPKVEVWASNAGDLAVVGFRSTAPHDGQMVAKRASEAPYKEALATFWGVRGAEGFFSGFLAGDGFARAVLDGDADRIDTDDLPVVEFGFSRSVGQQTRVEAP